MPRPRQPIRLRIPEQPRPQHLIARKLERLIGGTRIRQVHVADASVPPPTLAYVTPFPRLAVPIHGIHRIELAQHGRSDVVAAGRGHAILVPAHAWDRPQWSNHATVLTCLFGPRQLGFSLVRRGGATDAPLDAVKTSVHGAQDGVTRNILQALITSAVDGRGDRLDLLLVESLLHGCVRLLRHVEPHRHRKAALTYEAVCLYVDEHFQNPDLNRETVADRFGLAPNHISRLFAVEGPARFNDHLNTVRVNRAKFMLQSYPMSVKEIAANSGYSDAAYFCRVFRKVTGLTPLQYRTGNR